MAGDAQFKDTVRSALQRGYMLRLADYLERVEMDGDIEDKRKALDFQSRLLGLEPEKKADPNAGLPVFNFTFLHGGVQATQIVEEVKPEPVPELTVIETVPSVTIEPEKAPVARAPAPAAPPSADDLLGGLDDMLGSI